MVKLRKKSVKVEIPNINKDIKSSASDPKNVSIFFF